MNDLKDRIIMITGASSGFGKETAKMCVALGAKVVLGARREDKLKELCDELGSDSSIYKVTDVTSKDQMQALADYGIKNFGRIDSLSVWEISDPYSRESFHPILSEKFFISFVEKT